MRKAGSIILLIVILSLSILAQREEANCGIEGWITDKDPSGTNVRSQPSATAKVLKKLPHKSGDDAVTIYITGYSNGWVKIARAETIGGELLFDDIGWISAKIVATGTKGDDGSFDKPANLYAEANSKKKIGSIPGDAEVQIAGFSCGWIKVIYKGKTGWIRDSNVCGSPVTTCS